MFAARVTTAVYFGLFVTLDETGADGLVPVSTLGDDAFQLDERHQALVGQRTGESFALGDRVKVELVEADPVQGTLLFRLDSHEPGTRRGAGPGGVEEGRAAQGRRALPPAGAAASPPPLSRMRRAAARMAGACAWVMLTATLVGMTFSLADAAAVAVAGARRVSTRWPSASTPPPVGFGIFLVGPFVGRLVARLGRGRTACGWAWWWRQPACWSSRSGSIRGSGSSVRLLFGCAGLAACSC